MVDGWALHLSASHLNEIVLQIFAGSSHASGPRYRAVAAAFGGAPGTFTGQVQRTRRSLLLINRRGMRP